LNDVMKTRYAFKFALLLSLALHAAAAAVLYTHWHLETMTLPLPLTVALDAPPPLVVQPPLRQKMALPVLAAKTMPRAPQAVVIAIEQPKVEAVVTRAQVSTPALPAAEAQAAPGAAILATGREALVEPPHFNVSYLNNPRPNYPPFARRLGLEGVVLLRVEVSARGTAENIVIAQSSGTSVLDEEAMRAVKAWTFVPARRGQTPIAHAVEVPIRFQLRN